MQWECDFLGVLAGGSAYCMQCAQKLFGFEVVTAIFEEGQQGTFFFSLRYCDLKVMLFPVCSSCGLPFGQENEVAC